MTWQDDKRWSDVFLHEIKGILGQNLIGEPPQEEDTMRNTDLIVLKMEPVRIACRIRRNDYLADYSNEFTIRAGRSSGIKTELTKIIEGWGDYLFYAFSNKQETALSKWLLIDLRVFRIWFNRAIYMSKGKLPGRLKKNKDGSSSFISFDISAMPAEMFFAKSEEPTRIFTTNMFNNNDQ